MSAMAVAQAAPSIPVFSLNKNIQSKNAFTSELRIITIIASLAFPSALTRFCPTTDIIRNGAPYRITLVKSMAYGRTSSLAPDASNSGLRNINPRATMIILPTNTNHVATP